MSFDRVYLEIRVLSVRNHPDIKHLIVYTQPFIEHNFNGGNSSFTASNGFCLQSSSCPEIGGENQLYLRGDNTSLDYKLVDIPQEDYYQTTYLEKLRVAVREYNAYLDTLYDVMQNVNRPASEDLEFLVDEHELPGKRVVRYII